ncbi:unnamed protein product [Strongylus vulgaris]|uniref:Major facilitator superfamily (MFS) profile domain-containing protein n=1 Tax=Strongylus vulgaris TaxID=40348 RepID=A0A3P7I186_STRVU|nr:unnamed protein product [Strongylus vulgaris]
MCLVMIALFIREPERGAAERRKGEIVAEMVNTSYCDDIKALLSNLTYVFSTIAYTAIVFVVGTLTWWGPTACEHSEAHIAGLNSTDLLGPEEKAKINLTFGIITCIGGIVGVSLGSGLSMLLRTGWGPFKCVKTIRSDPIICGFGALIGIPALYFAIQSIETNMTVCYALIFVTVTTLCFNWATNVDMIMAVVAPTRRSAANSWQILLSHLLGDASGPYVIGLISDAIRGEDSTPYGRFKSLAKSFYLPNVLQLVSAVVFFVAAYTYVRDHNRFKESMGKAFIGIGFAIENNNEVRTGVLKPIYTKSLQGDVTAAAGKVNQGFSAIEREERKVVENWSC